MPKSSSVCGGRSLQAACYVQLVIRGPNVDSLVHPLDFLAPVPPLLPPMPIISRQLLPYKHSESEKGKNLVLLCVRGV